MTGGAQVSLVIPTHNSGRFLAETLASVVAQSHPVEEILVVDSGSTDDTLEIAARHAGVHVLDQGPGLCRAWNEGIAAARGDLIAFLDSDDLWHPRKLELQIAFLAHHADIYLVATRMRFFVSPGDQIPAAFDRPGLLDTDHASFFPGNLLVRRPLFDVVGGFDPDLEIAGDLDWFARIQDLKISTFTLPDTR
jgi:glycosyltransferase involved in cell wall biosynthesis